MKSKLLSSILKDIEDLSKDERNALLTQVSTYFTISSTLVKGDILPCNVVDSTLVSDRVIDYDEIKSRVRNIGVPIGRKGYRYLIDAVAYVLTVGTYNFNLIAVGQHLEEKYNTNYKSIITELLRMTKFLDYSPNSEVERIFGKSAIVSGKVSTKVLIKEIAEDILRNA